MRASRLSDSRDGRQAVRHRVTMATGSPRTRILGYGGSATDGKGFAFPKASFISVCFNSEVECQDHTLLFPIYKNGVNGDAGYFSTALIRNLQRKEVILPRGQESIKAQRHGYMQQTLLC